MASAWPVEAPAWILFLIGLVLLAIPIVKVATQRQAIKQHEERIRREREELLSLVSHDLKNPLGSMKTLLQVQLENPELPEALRRDHGIYMAGSGRINVAGLTEGGGYSPQPPRPMYAGQSAPTRKLPLWVWPAVACLAAGARSYLTKPLDVQQLLFSKHGKPRIAIISIAQQASPNCSGQIELLRPQL